MQIPGPVQLKGTLNTPWGPAQVEGIAEAAAERVVQDHRDRDDMRGWGESTVIRDGSGV